MKKILLKEVVSLLFHAAKGEISVSNAHRRRQDTNDEILDSISCRLGTIEGKLSAYHRKVSNDTRTSIQGESINLKGRSTRELFEQSCEEGGNWIVDGYMKVGLVNLVVASGGVGKTNFVTQIALAVAKGVRPEFLPDSCSVSVKSKVMYYRLEDFAGELKGKYGDGEALRASDITWFLREDLKEDTLNGFVSHLNALAESIEEDTLVCVDPATKLPGYKHEPFIRGVEEAMAKAKARGVSLTVLASIHLDEIKEWTVLSGCDIKGGDKAFQQAGSVVAFRKERTDPSTYRYLQCLKDPKGSQTPFYGQVLVCKAVVDELDGDNKYLHYEYVCLKSEIEARPLKPKAQLAAEVDVIDSFKRAPNLKIGTKEEAIIVEMHNEGKPISLIARTLKVSERTIDRHIKKLTGGK